MTKSKARQTRMLTGWAFLAPYGVAVALLIALPALLNVGYAFTDHTGLTKDPQFTGLDNVWRLLDDAFFLDSLEASLFHVTLSVPLRLLAAAFLVFCVLQLDLVPQRLLDAGDRAEFMLGVMLPPAFDDPWRLTEAAIESVQVAVVGTVFGVILSLILAIFAAKNVSPLGPLSWLIKGFAAFVRAVPSLVWALLFVVAVGLGPTPGILALAVNSTGMLIKVYAESIEEMPMGPIEALRASGASPLQIAIQGVLPSVARVFIAWSVFRFDINIRYASILGIVGAGGIGWELVRATQVGRYDIAIGVTLVIFIMVMLAELFSEWLQRRSDNAALAAAA